MKSVFKLLVVQLDGNGMQPAKIVLEKSQKCRWGDIRV